MEYTILGRTGLKVSVAGLGCGGPSRLGRRDNKPEKESIALVRLALDFGVNLIDTAEAYGTEEIVGKALAEVPRDQVVISTKKLLPLLNGWRPEKKLREGLEQSLRLLRTDYVDIYHLHGVEPGRYEACWRKLVPQLLKLRDEGKIRFLGITEAFEPDGAHRMLQRALRDDCWDVVMAGFNILNQTARTTVFPLTIERKVGTLVMFAVRRALSQPARLKEVWAELQAKGLVDAGSNSSGDPLGFLLQDGIVASLPEAAYRYCRHEPGVQVVLTGTGNVDHLKANIESMTKPPLPREASRRLGEMFARVDCVAGN